MATVLKLDADTARERFGFPQPRGGATVLDAQGLVWRWVDEHPNGLGRLGDLGAWQTVAGQTGVLAGAGISTIGTLAGAGAIAGPVGAIVGLIAGVFASIFGQHAAKVAQENKISGQWASSGPQTISAIVQSWQSGQTSTADAQSALDQVYAAFLQNNQSITKLNGQQGAYPTPTNPRPSNNCNWACGTSWDLFQEIQGLKGQMSSADPTGLSSGSFSLSNPLVLGGLALLGVLLLRK